MPGINQRQTSDAYNVLPNPASILDVFTSSGGWFSVDKAQVAVQLQWGPHGEPKLSDEQALGAGAFGTIPPGCTGIQFRSLVAGTPATVTAYIGSGGPPPDPRRSHWPEPVLAISALGNITNVTGVLLASGIRTANVSTVGATFATGADVLVGDLNFTADGTSSYLLEVSARGWVINVVGQFAALNVKLDGVDGGAMGQHVLQAGGALAETLYARAPIVAPAAGAHQVNGRLFTSGGGSTAVIAGGVGGVGNDVPILVTLSKLA